MPPSCSSGVRKGRVVGEDAQAQTPLSIGGYGSVTGRPSPTDSFEAARTPPMVDGSFPIGMADQQAQAASDAVKPSPTCVAFHQGAVSIPSDIQRTTLAWFSSGNLAQAWRCIGAATATSAMVGSSPQR